MFCLFFILQMVSFAVQKHFIYCTLLACFCFGCLWFWLSPKVHTKCDIKEFCCCSVTWLCLWPHGLHQARLPFNSLSPGVCSNLRSLPPMFSSRRFYGFRHHIQVLNPFCLYFYVWCKTVVQFQSFVYGCMIFPTQFI